MLLEGESVMLKSFFRAGWCFKLTEQPQELRDLGSSRKGGIREERKAVPMQ